MLQSKYRSHTCGELTVREKGQIVILAGWLHRKRDHGGLLFIDLRDHYGLTQCVSDQAVDKHLHSKLSTINLESVIQIKGIVEPRTDETLNPKLKTGTIEIKVTEVQVLSLAKQLPLAVNSDQDFPEETRLKYRFLDLRRENLHQNIILRSKVIASIRKKMQDRGFLEYQTPILTSSSPEGARDYLVPSRIHKGKFYALPQAPQQFKQLLMVAGFDRYFQIAPCFRDEDARADRAPGEFYQLDLEMSFVEQEDVFQTMEPVIYEIFTEFGEGKTISDYPFPRISYADAIKTYGSDKPDLRNPLKISNVSEVFRNSNFKIFKQIVDNGGVVNAIVIKDGANQPRSFFDKLNDWAKDQGQPGLGYIILEQGEFKGPIAKNLEAIALNKLKEVLQLENQTAVFVMAGYDDKNRWPGVVRTKLAQELNLIVKDSFSFCWIVDFPMYEYNEAEEKIDFSHNPFSMPQGGLEALLQQDPLKIKAYQYDIVCNGVELSSGAIRNHSPEIMLKAFAIAGYSEEQVRAKFGGMLEAFEFGAPPHGGFAPGIDRIVMLLAGADNLREVIAFPLNQKAEDLMMKAPAEIEEVRLKELGLKLLLKEKEKH